MGDGNKIPISHTGSTKLNASNNVFKLTHTLCAPSIKRKLLSVSKFCQDNLKSIEFFPFNFVVKDLQTRKPLVHGRTNNGLYEWPVSHPQAHIISTSSPLTTWHQRLGHPHSRVLRFILNKFSLPFHERDKNFHCNSCLSNKVHRHPFTQLSLSSSKPLQIIFSDLWGPSPVLSLDKKLYYCIFVDQYTKYTWLYTLTKKSEVKEIFQKFHPMMEKHFDTVVS